MQKDPRAFLDLDAHIEEATQFDLLLREATQTVEQELALEDKDWVRLGGMVSHGLTNQERIVAIQNSRLYFIKDPLARQAIRLWTDYTFGSGMTVAAPKDQEATQDAIKAFWNGKQNRTILGAQGQRKSSDKLLVDGELFFALFLGPDKTATLRRIDTLEITEIISDPDDIEDVMYYKREWTTPQGKSQKAFYRSLTNLKGLPTLDSMNNSIKTTEGPLVLHVAINTITQRGNPLLLPAIDWIKQYRRFLASRVAIMLALTRFAWKNKIDGGAGAVAAAKATYDDKTPDAGSMVFENQGANLTPIKADSGARNAADDARLIKLQIVAGVGLFEQYFGDISTGNLATAKTVELPMLKMFQSNQQLWKDTYRAIDDAVLEHAGVAEDKWYVDLDFAAIAPEDAAGLAASIKLILDVMPTLADAEEVQQVALQALGVDDVAKVLEDLKTQEATPGSNVARLIRSLREELQRRKGE